MTKKMTASTHSIGEKHTIKTNTLIMETIMFNSLKDKVKKELKRSTLTAVDGKRMDGEFITCQMQLLVSMDEYSEEVQAILKHDYFAMDKLNVDKNLSSYAFYIQVENILKSEISKLIDRIDVRRADVLVNLAKAYRLNIPQWLADGDYGVELGEDGWELFKVK